jgi:hypothetical protein
LRRNDGLLAWLSSREDGRARDDLTHVRKLDGQDCLSCGEAVDEALAALSDEPGAALNVQVL